MDTLLVTGASGFVGRHVLQHLARRGVHAVARGDPPPELRDLAIWHRADLLDPADRSRLCRTVGADGLLHLAWVTAHGRFWDDPSNVDWVASTLNLVRTFQAAGGSRVVVAGTCAEYDWEMLPDRIGEGAPRRPATLYGVAKDATFRLLSAFAEGRALSLAWGRLFFLYGPHDGTERLVPQVARALLEGGPALLSSGHQIRDFMDVREAAAALVALLDSPAEGPVNIATGRPVAIAEVAETLGRLVGSPELVMLGALPDRPLEPPRIVADTGRLENEVGFDTDGDLEDGLRDVLAWLANART